MDTPWGLRNWFFSKVVERTPVEDVLIMNGLSCFLYKFFSSTLLKRQFQGLPVGDHDRALILEVYGLWAWPKWSWPSETNSNHSLLWSCRPFFLNAWFQNFRIFFIAKSDTLRSNTPFLLNDDYQEVSIWPLNKPLKMAKWGFWFEHVIFLYKNAWFSSRKRRKKYFSLLPGFCTKMHDFLNKIAITR